MATFVVPVEDQSVDGQSAPRKRWAPAALVTGLAGIAFLVEGYHPYAEDGGLYLAGVERFVNPSLFPHATEFVMEPTRYSSFAAMCAALVRLTHFSIPTAVLVLHLLSLWATLYAAWMLACRCWTNLESRCGAVVLLALWMSLPVAGTALVLMDPYLTARSFSTPCIIFALVGMLDATDPLRLDRSGHIRSLSLWLGALTLAAIMHPLMAAYAFAASLVLACRRSSSSRVRRAVTAALMLSAFVAAAVVSSTTRPESEEYRRIALTRTYWFPAEWAWYEVVGLVAPLLLLAIGYWQSRHRTGDKSPPNAINSLTSMALLTGATAWTVAAAFARPTSSTYWIARMQPLRVFHVAYIVMVLLLGAVMGRLLLRRNPWRWGASAVALGSLMFAASLRTFPYSPHLEIFSTASRNPWVQAFRWIRDSTPRDALFALDPDYINRNGEGAQCFRAIAERSALPDYSKDGGEASIAPQLTPAWIEGQRAQRVLNSKSTTDATRVQSLRPMGVSWVVLHAGTDTHFDCPFSNAAVKVCRLP